MRILKKFLIYILSVTFALGAFGCGGKNPPQEPLPENPTPSTPTLVAYDDKNAYSAKGYDSNDYGWSDFTDAYNGSFPDGDTKKPFSTLNSGVAATTDNGEAQLTYYQGASFKKDKTIDQEITSGVLGSYQGDDSFAIADDEKIACFSIKDSKNATLSVAPTCLQQDFCDADNIVFYLAISHPFGGENRSVTLTVKDIFGAKLITLYRSRWYKVTLSVDSYLNYYGGYNFQSKADYFNKLKDGAILQFTSSESATSERNDFKVYFTAPMLTVDAVYGDLGERNITDLTATNVYNNAARPQNAMVYWTDASVERRVDENGVTRRMFVTECSHDGGNIAIIPLKKLSQILKYDYLTMVMYIETENPYPIAVGYNGNYIVSTKKVVKMVGNAESGVPQFVSANKWITFKIPVKNYIDRIYGMLKNNSVYTDTSLYTRYNDGFQLFYIHGDFVNQYPLVFDEPYTDKEKTYGYKLYISRMVLEKN